LAALRKSEETDVVVLEGIVRVGEVKRGYEGPLVCTLRKAVVLCWVYQALWGHCGEDRSSLAEVGRPAQGFCSDCHSERWRVGVKGAVLA
jgi:hypothetical protein